MSPQKTKKIGDNLVEQFYWNGSYFIYINNRKFDGSFDEAVSRITSK